MPDWKLINTQDKVHNFIKMCDIALQLLWGHKFHNKRNTTTAMMTKISDKDRGVKKSSSSPNDTNFLHKNSNKT